MNYELKIYRSKSRLATALCQAIMSQDCADEIAEILISGFECGLNNKPICNHPEHIKMFTLLADLLVTIEEIEAKGDPIY